VKETTLDYTRDFAERRGIAEQMGVRSEIEIPGDRAAGLRAGRESTAEDHAFDRRSSQKVGADLAQDLRADPHEDLAGDRQQRRSRFEGLKLSRGASAERPAAQDRDELAQDRPEKAETRRRGMFDGCSSMPVLALPRTAQTGRKGEGACGRRRRTIGLPNAYGRSRRLSRPLTATRGPMNPPTVIGARACPYSKRRNRSCTLRGSSSTRRGRAGAS